MPRRTRVLARACSGFGGLRERRFHHPHFQRFAGQHAGQGKGLVGARYRTADNFGTTSWSEVRAASLNDDRSSVVHPSIDHVDHTREADSDSAFTDEQPGRFLPRDLLWQFGLNDSSLQSSLSAFRILRGAIGKQKHHAPFSLVKNP